MNEQEQQIRIAIVDDHGDDRADEAECGAA